MDFQYYTIMLYCIIFRRAKNNLTLATLYPSHYRKIRKILNYRIFQSWKMLAPWIQSQATFIPPPTTLMKTLSLKWQMGKLIRGRLSWNKVNFQWHCYFHPKITLWDITKISFPFLRPCIFKIMQIVWIVLLILMVSHRIYQIDRRLYFLNSDASNKQ